MTLDDMMKSLVRSWLVYDTYDSLKRELKKEKKNLEDQTTSFENWKEDFYYAEDERIDYLQWKISKGYINLNKYPNLPEQLKFNREELDLDVCLRSDNINLQNLKIEKLQFRLNNLKNIIQEQPQQEEVINNIIFSFIDLQF